MSSIFSRAAEDAAADRRLVRTIATVVASAGALYLVYRLRTPLVWLVIAAILAIAASGPVNLLARRMRRGFAIAIVYLLMFLVPTLLGAALLPPLVNSAVDLARDVPGYVNELQDQLESNATFRNLNRDFGIYEELNKAAANLTGNFDNAAKTLGQIGTGLINSIFAAFTILILSMFMVSRGRNWVDAMISRRPKREAVILDRTASRIGIAVGGYIGGALFQAFVAGVTAFIVLAALGMPSPLVLATIVAIFDLIPLVGSTIAGVIIAAIALFAGSFVDALIWAIYFVPYQQFENYVIQPQIQKRAVQLEPFIVLIAVLFGGTLMGVLGAILAIPVAATIQILYQEYKNFRRELQVDDNESTTLV